MITQTHRILMCGAVEDSGAPVKAGDYRTHGAHSGTGTVYLHADAIPKALARLVDEFNSDSLSPLHAASRLFYRFLMIHPFSNGNGRRVCLEQFVFNVIYNITVLRQSFVYVF